MNWCIILICCLGYQAKAQIPIATLQKQWLHEKGKLFFVGRGTVAKQTLLADQFNCESRYLTHVGLAMIVNDRFTIYHVSDVQEEKGSAFVETSLEEFISLPEIFYWGIWEMELPPDRLNRIIDQFIVYKKRVIRFDAQFLLSDDDDLYCSEFCALVLSKAGVNQTALQPVEIILNNPFIKAFLGREMLCYYPVDFFLNLKGVQILYEYKNSLPLINKMP
jgi:hypothetical protein